MGNCCIRTKEKDQSTEKNREAIINHIKIHSNRILTQPPESPSEGGSSPSVQLFSADRTRTSTKESYEASQTHLHHVEIIKMEEQKAVRKDTLEKTLEPHEGEEQEEQVIETMKPRVRSEKDLQGVCGQIEELCGEETEMGSPTIIDSTLKGLNGSITNKEDKLQLMTFQDTCQEEKDEKDQSIQITQEQNKETAHSEGATQEETVQNEVKNEQISKNPEENAENPLEEQDEFSKLLSERLKQDLLLNNEQFRRSTHAGSINISSQYSSTHSSKPTSKPLSRPLSPQEPASDGAIPAISSMPPVQLRKDSSQNKRQDTHQLEETVRKFERKKLLKQFSQNMVGHIYLHTPIHTPTGVASNLSNTNNSASHAFSSQGIPGYSTPSVSEQNGLRNSWANISSARPPSKAVSLRGTYPARFVSDEKDPPVPNSLSIPDQVFESVIQNQNLNKIQ